MTEETLKRPIFRLHSRNKHSSLYRNRRETLDNNGTDVLPYTHGLAPKEAALVHVEAVEAVQFGKSALDRLPPLNNIRD